MHWRLTALSVLICLAIFLRELLRLEIILWSSGHAPGFLDTPADPESLLAQGRKLPLRCMTAVDLELIPGITERLAGKILLAASMLASQNQEHDTASALQEITGIGPKKGESLSRLVSFEGACRQTPGQFRTGENYQGPRVAQSLSFPE